MECRDAQFYLRLRRHAADELGSDVTAALEGHLAGCQACAADARAAAAFDRAMASAMRAVPVPAGLREQLVAHVASKQGAILRRKFYRAATAAAAAVVLVFLGFGLFSTTRPKVDMLALVENGEMLMSDPAESTRQWLAEQKVPGELPYDFDYNLLISRDLVKVQGRDVPALVFRSPDPNDPRGFAKVYIFREGGGFDLKGLQDAQGSHTSAKVEAVGETRYVILYTGLRLDPFLNTRKTGAPIL